MDKLKPLSDFFTAIDKDPRISITHIGLYAALLQYWSEHHFENPVYVFSYDVMSIAKISASTTFHKTIRELNEYGYIKYEPSFKRNKGSKVYFIRSE
jgi:hypothetical protein